MSLNYSATSIPATRAHSLAFFFFLFSFFDTVSRVWISCFGLSRSCSFSLTASFPYRPSRRCSCSNSSTESATRAYPHDLVQSFSRCSNSNAVVKSLVMASILQPPRRCWVSRGSYPMHQEQLHRLSLVPPSVDVFTFYFVQGIHS